MNWSDNLRSLAELAGDSGLYDDPDFLSIMPACIRSAESRILRDLDLLAMRISDDTGQSTQHRKVFVLPQDVGTFVVVEQVRAILSSPSASTGIYGPPLLATSKDTIDALWPDENAPSQPSVPYLWAPLDQARIYIGPPPDQDYFMSVHGTMRPLPFSQKNNPTFISEQLADLFLAAEMLFLSAYQRNWSSRADDPQMSVSWNAEYERLKGAAAIEEARKKVQSIGWSVRQPSPLVDHPPTPRP